ncbi:unnamed protein product [Acanthoscelides obtectus]|uniref:THAP-type domain-containing protein n=1 Tax=Acanthoscelides obtectus TaxID=200917 RepID=A0A9P0LSH6_ACAOB|nr:unnamed protein product [Acanthoscelides obtectus]CAK1667784.1 hypothetical protein AOBTE_LOCUS26035 [Acanthoscelides obtectus]
MYIFPKKADRCQFSVKFVNRGEWTPTRSSVICSKHFSEESFDRTLKCTVNLKPNAVPTIHPKQEESPPAKILVLSNTVLRPNFDSSLLQTQAVSIRHHSNKLILFRGQ